MKLIHCSDIHLDSRMETTLSAKQAQERNNEICTTFTRMISYAVENDVSVVMIAGDMFDTARISAKTSSFILDSIAQAPNVDFLYLQGNHDESARAFAGNVIPDNLKLFSDHWTEYTYDFLTISGIELNHHNCMTVYQDLSLSDQQTNIVMMHGQDTTTAGDDQICIPALRGKNIDYLALGHLHSYQKKKLDMSSEYCYCGCLEGRGFDECGEKGFVLVNAEPHHITTEFIPFAKRTLHNVCVDITNATTITDIRQAMAEAAKEIPNHDLVEFRLVGTYTLDTQKDITFLKQLFEHRYYAIKIKDESHLFIEKESYENDISLKGEFIRKVMASELTAEEKDEIICAGIQALSGEAIML